MNSKPHTTASVLTILLLLVATTAFSQFGDRLKNGLRYYHNSKDSSHFIQFAVTNQIWVRYTKTNPYTAVQTNLANTPASTAAQPSITDISIRRIRFVLSGQLNDRVAFFVQFGQNNLNYLTARKAGSFFHDVTADYAFIKKKLQVGFGLNGWNGPTRFSNISIVSILVLDPPGYQEATNDTYDVFVRRLGMYAKGKLGKFDYRVSWAKPFTIQTTSGSSVEPINGNYSVFSSLPPKMVTQGYFMYQFKDQESNFGPGMTGTYLGKKKVMNIGVGGYYQKDAMYHLNGPDTVKQNILMVAADFFYDTPINTETGTAFSLYASVSSYNFGKDFIKVTGPDNPANATRLPGTASSFEKLNYGNAFPYLGTGTIGYFQTGYKFKNNLLGEQGTLQPFANIQYSQYDRLKSPMYVWDVGINWLIKGHFAKFTLDYQNRPYFKPDAAGDLKENARKGQFVLQYQIAF